MRWDNLRIDEEQEARLPNFKEPALVRTFDAPEAMGIRFYEVRARSGINAVPKRSRMPFRFTINPYRGCTHACVYCLDGETPILMGDGQAKRLRDIQVGDRVYGTVREGWYRRYAVTTVLDHWASIKPAHRITLEDGTELVASGDHRFLTERGWKCVTGHRGRGGRPHLTARTRLRGFGGLPSSVEGWMDYDYRRGYLCGLIRGDGHVSSSVYDRPGVGPEARHVFRLAMSDIEPLMRAREYLHLGGIEPQEYVAHDPRGRKSLTVLQAAAGATVSEVAEIIKWPRDPSESWCKGYLAGIFDAEGSRSGGLVRIANTDPEIIDWTCWALRRLGFSFRLERTNRANGLVFIRLLGGLPAQLRFLFSTGPATTRKRSIEGTAIRSPTNLGVVAVEPIPGARRLYDITTGTGDFIANGVVSHNCFARPTHTYLDFNAAEDFEREIVVKVNVPELVRAELGRPSWGGDHVALGTNTDPYQWVEGRYRLMEGIWEAMRDAANPCSVLTKSPLLLRDLGLFRQLVERTDFSTALSIPTLDEKAWRETEPHTPHPRKRLEAVGELTRAGIPCSILVAPLIPGVNDDPKQVEEILEIAGEMGAATVTGIGLHLRGEVREIFFDWLRQYRPDLIEHYEQLYARGAYLPSAEKKRLGALTNGFRCRASAPRAPGWRGRGISREKKGPSPRERPATRQARLF